MTSTLFDLPHVEARRRLESGAPVYLTINPVEYHGPHLSLHNDRLISVALIERLHARLRKVWGDWPLLIASDLEIGVEPCSGIGSRHTSFATARELVCEACRALAELGAQRVVLMTFHGSPLHNLALEAGVELLTELGVAVVSPFNWVLRELLQLDDAGPYAEAFAHVENPEERTAMMREMREDFHAGFFETSVALHLVPGHVSEVYRQLPPCPELPRDPSLQLAARAMRALGRDELARELQFAAAGKGWYAMRPFYGYTGRPHRATARAGEIFSNAILDRYQAGVPEVLAGRARSPKPIMSWVQLISLGGRLAGLEVSPEQMVRHEGVQ